MIYDFDMQASDSIKHPRNYARNFLEYCCFRALAQVSQVAGYLADKSIRRLTFDMMLVWEVPSSSGQLTVKVDYLFCLLPLCNSWVVQNELNLHYNHR
jgi:hypothetical protein